MEKPVEKERYEMFEELLDEFGLMPHYCTVQEATSEEPTNRQEQKPNNLDIFQKEPNIEMSDCGKVLSSEQTTIVVELHGIKQEIIGEYNTEAPSTSDPVQFTDKIEEPDVGAEQNPDDQMDKNQNTGSLEFQKSFSCSDCSLRCDSYADLMNHTCERGLKKGPSKVAEKKKRDCFKVHFKKKVHARKKVHRDKKVHLDTKLHSQEKVQSENKVHLCTTCGKIYRHRATLLDHIKTHTKEKLNSCVICNKSFYRKRSLKVHMRSHSTGKLIYSNNW